MTCQLPLRDPRGGRERQAAAPLALRDQLDAYQRVGLVFPDMASVISKQGDGTLVTPLAAFR